MKTINKLLIVGLLVFGAGVASLSVSPSVAEAQACLTHASKQCISNIVYWYNSCGALEDIAQNCNSTNQLCQNAACVNKAPVTPPPPANDVKSCYNGNLHYYSSTGTVGSLYQTCKDNNSCTLDDCTGSACINALKCDGSTCATGSQDYITYCTTQNPPEAQQPGQGLIISAFAKKGSIAPDWQKNVTLASNDNVDFLIIVKNISTMPISGVLVKTDLTNNISYTGNLKIGELTSGGNITSGVDLGTIAPKASQVISFTGTIAPQLPQAIVQINTNVSASNVLYDSDYVIANINPTVVPAATGNSFIDKLKNFWWVWILLVAALAVVLFFVVSRKSATN